MKKYGLNQLILRDKPFFYGRSVFVKEGIGLDEVIHGEQEYVMYYIIKDNIDSKRHKAKVYYDNRGQPYFYINKNNKKEYLDKYFDLEDI